MTVLPEVVRQAWENRDGPAVFATVDEAGVPNVIYVGAVGLHNNERIVIADNYFHKTRRNVLRGGIGAFLFLDKPGKSYQMKGKLEYYTDGEIFELMKSWNPPQHPGHAAAALLVEQVFCGAEQLA